ncbi:MAG: 2-oxoacid:acceptor oxidoreductase subunit alpha [Nitrososphaerales archaeon]
MVDEEILTGEHFISGNFACAEGAIAAGCRFFAGYPITPSTDIAERMAQRLIKLNGIYLEMEDELGSINAVLGASCAGVKAMTATSGPGFSLMMEGIGYGIMGEIPCVIVNVMRGGPSTGLPTLVGQGDVMQARWGTHGVHEIITLAPSSPQEMFNLTIKAFNLSEQFRTPVILLSDEVVSHMNEKVVIPNKNDIYIYERRKPKLLRKEDYLPFKPDEDLVPPMVNAGEGYYIHITGLTHDERGYPATNPEAQERLVRRLVEKIRNNADKIIDYKEVKVEDADVIVVAYGITSRVAMKAIELARNEGIKAGLLQLITIWPFPEKRIRELAERIKGFVIPEINYGQIAFEVERCASGLCNTIAVPKMGGAIHKPSEILDAIIEAARAEKIECKKSAPLRFIYKTLEGIEALTKPAIEQHPRDKYLRSDRLPHIFCQGCGIGIVINCYVKVLEEAGLNRDKVVVVSGIGCTGRIPGYLKLDSYHTLHGRAIPFATGLKLANPELKVTVFGGDGDLFAIGANHFIHAARRNVDLNVICVNNFNYGMTGGQSGPTTPFSAKTTTTPYGNIENPFNLPYLAAASGAVYVARWTTYHVRQLRRSMIECFLKKGFTFIEVISPCPTGYGRPNKIGDSLAQMEYFRENARIKYGANPIEGNIELGKPFIVGKFLDTERPSFIEVYNQTFRAGG